MSSYPQRIDKISYIVPSVSANNLPGTSTVVGFSTLKALQESLSATEGHLGFSILSGGDIRPDGTSVIPGPGRKFALLRLNYSVPPSAGGLFAFLIPWKGLIDERTFNLCLPTPASGGVVGSYALSKTQSPILISGIRNKKDIARVDQKLNGTIVTDSLGVTYLALSCISALRPFIPGESLKIVIVFEGGF